MKSCPRCGKSYPDTERFCEEDGTALGETGASPRETTIMQPGEATSEEGQGGVQCPVCGGKAEPGEEICNFCGTRLQPSASSTGSSEPAPGRESHPATSPSDFAPSDDRTGPYEMGNEEPTEDEAEESSGRRIFGVVGFSIAAAVALVGGALLAFYLSSERQPLKPVVQASPTAAPTAPLAVVAGPFVQLADNIPLKVTGAGAAAPERDHATLMNMFETNKSALVNAYKNALAGNASLSDGMAVRLHIMPDGSVSAETIRVSTSPTPDLDAAVAKEMSGWKFPNSSGGSVDADYSIIFATDHKDIAGIESALNSELASLGSPETPEYASAVAPTPAPARPPAVAVATPPPMIAPTPAPRPRRKEYASVPKPAPMPKPSLLDRVNNTLRSNRKFRRVKVYTNGSSVILYGKVFDSKDKLLAVRTVRGVTGVSSVTDNLDTDEADWARTQAQIVQQLQSAGLTGVTVKVIGHDAFLGGQVQTELDKQRAVTIAERSAVKVRTNLITVAPGRVFGF